MNGICTAFSGVNRGKPSRSNHPLQSSSYHPDNIFGDYTQLLWNMLFIVTDVIGGAVAVMSASTERYLFFIRRGSNYLLHRGQRVHVAAIQSGHQAE